jgi:hypothetical protein
MRRAADISDATWTGREEIPARSAPLGRDALPVGKAGLDYGNGWIKGEKLSVLRRIKRLSESVF